jgi:hypothetical protein
MIAGAEPPFAHPEKEFCWFFSKKMFSLAGARGRALAKPLENLQQTGKNV